MPSAHFAAPADHRVFVIPGLFGFTKLAGYDYCEHADRAIARHMADAGAHAIVEPLVPLPTASLKRRALMVAQGIALSAGDDDFPIHLVGHSTGGLDARLVVSPSVMLDLTLRERAALARVRSIVTINTPHFGTPLATYFATAAGTRLLYAVSMLTVATLTLGSPPLSLLSSLVAQVSSLDRRLGIDSKFLDRITQMTLSLVGDESRADVREFFSKMELDKGGILQLVPEVMDLFGAVVKDAPGVRYGCVATCATQPGASHLLRSVRSPLSALTATLFSTLYSLTAAYNPRYSYATVSGDVARRLEHGLGRPIDESMNDGVVPTASMLHGELLYAGRADHLDVLGHFLGDKPHTDWLNSGSKFDKPAFEGLYSAVAAFLLAQP